MFLVPQNAGNGIYTYKIFPGNMPPDPTSRLPRTVSTQVPIGPVSIGVEVQRNTDGDTPSIEASNTMAFYIKYVKI